MATDVWPWLALAGAGAMHGLSPLGGWPLAAWRAGPSIGAQWPRLLGAMATGHLASILAMAAAVPATVQLGLQFDTLLLQGVAAVLLVLLLARHVCQPAPAQRRPMAGAAFALWSFILGVAQGTGWMLLPALASICASGMPGQAITQSGSLLLGLAAVAVHMGAMLATTAVMATGAQALSQGSRRA